MTPNADQHRPAANGPAQAAEPWPGVCEPWRAFADWAVDQLGAELTESADGYRVRRPSESPGDAKPTSDSGLWPLGVLTRRRQPNATETAEPLDFAAASAEELVDRLLAEVGGLDERPTLVPAGQPAAAHEIAGRLFDAYTVDNGKVHLAGCRLEATPIIRWSARDEQQGEPVVRHAFFRPDGGAIGLDLAATLALNGPLTGTPAIGPAEPVTSPGVIVSQGLAGPLAPTATVLAKRAVGSLQASIGEVDVAIPFDGWARELRPPPAACPETGAETYHLVALDDGRVAAAEATGVCDKTGRRLLLSDLRTCRESGRRLAAELCVTCPVSGEPVAKTELAECPRCGQRAGRSLVGGDRCGGCRVTSPIGRDAPLRKALLDAAPVLRRWRGWRMAETNECRIVEASTLWKRIVVVFDLASGRPRHAATRPRFGGSWAPLPLSDLRG